MHEERGEAGRRERIPQKVRVERACGAFIFEPGLYTADFRGRRFVIR